MPKFSPPPPHEPLLIAAPRLLPYKLHNVCPACGYTMRPWDRLKQILFRTADLHLRHGFCPGGKAPTEDTSLLSPLGNTQQVTLEFACAGVTQPHLHLFCGKCNYQWLTETRTRMRH